jgi:hypothetical protein
MPTTGARVRAAIASLLLIAIPWAATSSGRADTPQRSEQQAAAGQNDAAQPDGNEASGSPQDRSNELGEAKTEANAGAPVLEPIDPVVPPVKRVMPVTPSAKAATAHGAKKPSGKEPEGDAAKKTSTGKPGDERSAKMPPDKKTVAKP